MPTNALIIEYSKINPQPGDMLIAFTPPLQWSGEDLPVDLKIKWRFFYDDISYLHSTPAHIIFGVIRNGIFHYVED